MKKFRISFLLCFLGIGLVNAQDNTDSLTNNIITTPKFREGVYRSFEEFKNNNPSIVDGFEILDEPGNLNRYQLELNKNIKAPFIYGFSDGEMLYINNSRAYSRKGPFVRILIRGTIMYYEDFSTKSTVGGAYYGSGLGMAAGLTGALIASAIAKNAAEKNPGWIIYMPDDIGDGILLDKKNVKSILKETDRELYDEYMKQPLKGGFETLFDFIIRYNKRVKID